jgi:signal transduction histidine kinase/CheY-like chemotaxis protein
MKKEGAQKAIGLHRQWGFNAARQAFLLEVGRESIDNIGKLLKVMYDHEGALLKVRSESQRESLQRNKASIFLLVLFLFLALLVVYYVIRRDLEERKSINMLLKASKETAEKASCAKGEFLANMSHEIRTPMNAIIGMTELLGGTRLTSEQKKFIEVLSRAGESLLMVINDILDFSKIESGQLRLDMADFDVKKAVKDVADILACMAKKKGIEVKVFIEDDLPDLIMGDEHHLKQVLYNLIGNAIKFTEKGEVRVTLALEQGITTEGRYLLRFSVSDTGIGISREQQKLIFERFTQADRSTTRRFGGTGLGTTIARGIVELMEGRVWIESEIGKGSTFHFTALFEPPCGETRPALPTEEAQLFDRATDERPMNILIAEDMEDNRLLIQCYLKKTPHTLAIAENGEEAIKMFKANRYDMVLMDMEMPIRDGYSATCEIRKWEAETRREETPIIALTAHAMKEYVQKSMDAGCSGHVNKPIKKQPFLDLVREYADSPKNGKFKAPAPSL